MMRRMIARGLPTDTMESKFGRIYRMNLWRGAESACGPGSSLKETAVVRRELPRILRDVGARSMLDIPCGDFFWMKEVELDLDLYIGADVVSSIVDENIERYGSTSRSFFRLDICLDPLPQADLVLCRDCLDHLSFQDVRAALSNLATSGSTFLLATTYPDRRENVDIRSGDWRPLNLQADPFRLPPPLEILNERSRKPRYPDKSLGLWRIADLPSSAT